MPEQQDISGLTRVVQSLEERVARLEKAIGTLTQRQDMPTTVTPAQQRAQALMGRSVAPAKGDQPKPRTSTEIEIGQKWLSVVGVILIFLAALFFVQFVFRFVGPAGKVFLSYAGAAILFGVAIATQKKYGLFSAVVGAGAWGVTYLVTYAMHFFPATRIVVSTPLAMFLLTVVVALLIAMAMYQKSKPLLAVGLVLGFLTMVLSPLSLFSIVGTVLLLAVFVALAVMLPWGDFILPAAIGGYISYFFWFTNVLGRLPAQGGGLLEKEMLGLVALVVMWLIVVFGLVSRRDAESEALGGQADSAALLIATSATALLGFSALEDLTLTFTTPRLAKAIWLLLLAGLQGGWSFIAFEWQERKEPVTVGALLSVLLLMSGIAYVLPEQSSGTALAWAALGLVMVVFGLLGRNVQVAAMSAVPLVASAVRFIASDMQKRAVSIDEGLSLLLLLGFLIAGVIAGSAALLRTLDLTVMGDKRARRLPGVLLAVGLVVFYAITADELTGAVPSVLWSVAGLATVAAGFLAHWKDARVVGLLALAVAVGRVFMHDLAGLEALPRVISFAILGGLLLLVGYGYNHNKEKLQKYLDEE